VDTITVRYWAGAKAAAGLEQESLAAGTLGELVTVLGGRRPALAPVLAVSTFLRRGTRLAPEAVLTPGDEVEVLPPFAGG
jgi:molybdopterin converting factor small subunit